MGLMQNNTGAALRLPREDNRRSDRLIVCALLLGVVIYQALLFWNSSRVAMKGNADFIIFYTAGRIVASGSREALYDYELQRKLELEISPRYQRALVYNHPPFEALLFTPLARLPYRRAYICWLLVNLSLLCVLPVLLWRHLKFASQSLPELLYLSFFSFFPILSALLQGQDSILLLLLATLAFVGLREGKEFRAGCYWGLGLFRFPIVLPIAVLFLFRRRVRFLLGLLTVGTLFSVLSLAVVGYKGCLDYIDVLHKFMHNPAEQQLWSWSVNPTSMPTLRGFLASSLPNSWPQAAKTGFYLVFATLIVLGITTLHKTSQEKRTLSPLLYGLDLVAALMLSYHSFLHDGALLILPLLFCIDYLQSPAASPRAHKSMGGVVALLLLPLIYLALLVQGKLFLLFPVFLTLAALMWYEIRSQHNVSPLVPESDSLTGKD